jgi:N-acetyl-alpha-D-muramate 1-phosphate uridylyltransferase
MNIPVAILAGGLATRLRPLTEKVPKSLVEVAGRPFAEWQLELLGEQGIERVVYCLGHLGERVAAALGDGSRYGVRCEYVFDGERLLGTGGALRNALPRLGDLFFVLYGDSYLPIEFSPVAEAFARSGKAGLMTVYENGDQWDRSNVALRGGEIVRYDKRYREPAMRHIDYGLGILTRAALEPYPPDQYLELEKVYQDLITENQLAAYVVAERFYEVGSFVGLQELNDLLSQRRSSDHERLTVRGAPVHPLVQAAACAHQPSPNP